jgi:hypothetical protein
VSLLVSYTRVCVGGVGGGGEISCYGGGGLRNLGGMPLGACICDSLRCALKYVINIM